MVRRVFFSFHYKPDNWRVSQIRNIGKIERNQSATDNDWETVKSGGESVIKRWISTQMHGRSCSVILVGNQTANRKWINHEIVQSWDKGMGIFGINIHGLLNSSGQTTVQGQNPFDYVTHGDSGRKLSSIVKCYNPPGVGSKEKYAWISQHFENAVEEAIRIRNQN